MNRHLDINVSNICKGIAIVWMMYHHLVPYTEFSSGPNINGIYLPGVLGITGKACVSIFLVLSGYGLYKTGGGYKIPFQFYLKRFKRIYLTYWIVFDIFTAIGIFFFRSAFIYLTNTPFSRTENLLCSLSGLQYFYKNSCYMGYNAAWWYIGLCISLYIAFPLLNIVIKNYPRFFISISILIYVVFWNVDFKFILVKSFLMYFPAFALGMILAHTQFFEKINERILNKEGIWKRLGIIGITILLILVKYSLHEYNTLGIKLDCLISFFVILNVYLIYFSYENNVWTEILKILGRYSFEIYLIHLFITNMYTTTYIYEINDAFWMVVVTLCISLLFAIPIQKVNCFLEQSKIQSNIAIVIYLLVGIILSIYGAKV